MSLILLQGTLNILEEENHIKDVLSRIVVEMIKREWPQHWPDMLIELVTGFVFKPVKDKGVGK